MNRQRVEELVGNFLFHASKGDVAAIQNLLDQGMLVDEADYDGRTALHLAASEGHTSVVKLLLENKADVNPIDRRGDTVGPLPFLCFNSLDPCFIFKIDRYLRISCPSNCEVNQGKIYATLALRSSLHVKVWIQISSLETVLQLW